MVCFTGIGYIGDSCGVDSDCVTGNSECRGEQCWCGAGYSFNPRLWSCDQSTWQTRGWEDDLRITLYRSKMQLSNQSLYRSKKQFKNLFSISQECDSRIHTFYKTRAWFSKPLTVTVVYQYEHWFGGITLLQLSSKSIEMFIKKYTCNNKFNDRTIGFENIFLDFIQWKNNQHCFSIILSNSSINKK